LKKCIGAKCHGCNTKECREFMVRFFHSKVKPLSSSICFPLWGLTPTQCPIPGLTFTYLVSHSEICSLSNEDLDHVIMSRSCSHMQAGPARIISNLNRTKAIEDFSLELRYALNRVIVDDPEENLWQLTHWFSFQNLESFKCCGKSVNFGRIVILRNNFQELYGTNHKNLQNHCVNQVITQKPKATYGKN